jgi:hypothetical protein
MTISNNYSYERKNTMNNGTFKKLLQGKLCEIDEESLTADQKSTIETLLHWISSCKIDYDSFIQATNPSHNTKRYKPTHPITRPASKLTTLLSYYNGTATPMETPFETPDTTALWHEIIDLEKDLMLTLTSEQLDSFQQLQKKNLNATSYSNEDSFCHGFQTGAKLMIDILY